MSDHTCTSPIRIPPIMLAYGAAIDRAVMVDEEGWFVLGNDEYATWVAFCPWCGAACPAAADIIAKEMFP